MKRLLAMLLAAVFVLVPITSLASEDTDLGQRIINEPTTDVYRMRAWAIQKGANQDFIDQAENFYKISVEYGIDPAVTYAQSAKETNYFRFTGVLTNEFKNTCGLKTTKGGGNYDPEAHKKFDSWEEGIRAQVHHLALYAGHEDFPMENSPDPRHFPSIYGKAPRVEDLGGKWAPSRSYGVEIVEMMKQFADVDSTFELEEEVFEEPEDLDLKDPRPEDPNSTGLAGETITIIDPDEKPSITRIFGADRSKTSIEISKKLSFRRPARLILAPGDEFTSALLASSLSYKDGTFGPILLAGKNLDQATMSELLRARPEEVIIIGSEGQVSKDYERALFEKGISARRITGSNRYNTANIIAAMSASGEYILANGLNFADALTISAYAARENMPILFTDGTSLDQETQARLESADRVYIVGGVNSISQAIEDDLKEKTRTERIAGDNRFKTAIKIAERFFPESDRALVANGWDFPDSLSGSPLGGSLNAPILLTDQSSLNEDTASYLRAREMFNITVLGGNSSIGPGVYMKLSEYIK